MLIVAETGEFCIYGGTYKPACAEDNGCSTEPTSFASMDEFTGCRHHCAIAWYYDFDERDLPLGLFQYSVLYIPNYCTSRVVVQVRRLHF